MHYEFWLYEDPGISAKEAAERVRLADLALTEACAQLAKAQTVQDDALAERRAAGDLENAVIHFEKQESTLAEARQRAPRSRVVVEKKGE